MSAVRKFSLGDCRFYEQKYPKPDDLVMVKVTRIEVQGVYVALLEYNDKEGLILLSELSKRRYRSINKLVKVGRHEVALVLRVDMVKGYIDLSKRRVSPEDIIKCEERFSKSKKVHQTVRHVAQKHNIKIEDLNTSCIWPLYKKYPHALDALKEAVFNPDSVFKGLDVDPEIVQSIVQDVQLRLSPQALKLRCQIDVWCFGPRGVDAVKEALMIDFSQFDEELSVSVKLISPPQYELITTCYDKERGTNLLKKCIEAITNSITKNDGGEFKQRTEIIVMGDDEERHLESLIENQDGSSDDEESSDSSFEDEGMGKIEESAIPEDERENEGSDQGE